MGARAAHGGSVTLTTNHAVDQQVTVPPSISLHAVGLTLSHLQPTAAVQELLPTGMQLVQVLPVAFLGLDLLMVSQFLQVQDAMHLILQVFSGD